MARIAITGASGLVGRALSARLEADGDTVVPLVRSRGRAGDSAVYWKPSAGEIDGDALEGVDAVVHLAGESVFGRWTESKKKRILQSRVLGTRLIATTCAGLTDAPKILVSVSGANYYGDDVEGPVDESSPSGEGFLAEVCRRWEQECDPAREAGIRVVHPRLGVVHSAEGGALKTMLPIFKAGAGGRLGSGGQYVSWVSIEDVTRALRFLLHAQDLSGPVNVVSPNPVTNAELTRTLARVLGRPAFLPAPAFALKAAFGSGMAEEALLGSLRVVPRRLSEAGYEWYHPDLEGALRDLLGR